MSVSTAAEDLTRAAEAAADPLRPRYHFAPPANWMNDPNGPIYHDGYYHLFYQYNPFADTWGHIHWGHARSRDLLNWEHLPIALRPSYELSEQHCFSGCAAVDDQGRVILIYTSVSFERDGARLPFQQWAAIGTPDLLSWQKHPGNPVLALSTHDGPAVGGDWRDPFVFSEGGRTFLVLGANLPDAAAVLLYEAAGGDLIHWRYRGVLYSRPQPGAAFLECPNFVKVDGKWVLLFSPYRPVEYVVGDFDLATLQFTPEQEGVLDPGQGRPAPGAAPVPNFYATNVLTDPDGRRVLLAWARGFQSGRGWNGCLALPRRLGIGADGRPRQTPLPELARLRGPVTELIDERPLEGRLRLNGPFPAGLEIELAARGGAPLAVRLVEAGDATLVAQVRVTGEALEVQDSVQPFSLAPDELLRLRIFLDQSLLEVFAGDGRAAATRILETTAAQLRVELLADGDVAVERFAVWPIALQPGT